jgi:hypothetical protein
MKNDELTTRSRRRTLIMGLKDLKLLAMNMLYEFLKGYIKNDEELSS